MGVLHIEGCRCPQCRGVCAEHQPDATGSAVNRQDATFSVRATGRFAGAPMYQPLPCVLCAWLRTASRWVDEVQSPPVHIRKRASMTQHTRSLRAIAALLVGTAAATAAHAELSFVDFETNPGLAQGPSIFVAVPGVQTISTAPATFGGGVVLGLATFFPAISFASSPNVYGTADFGNHLSRTLTIDIQPNFITTQVSFALFNGETFQQSYTARAFDGATQVASQTLANVAANFNSGYGIIDLKATNITRVTIDADGAPAAFDFLIDDVAFNQSLTDVITTPLPPVYQPPVQPVEVVLDDLDVVEVDDGGHRQKRKRKGKGFVQIDFGEDLNDIRSEVLLFNQVTPVPEPSTWILLMGGLAVLGLRAARRPR